METIGIIGAGAMGRGIAKNLKKAGYPVIVYKRKIDENDSTIIYLRNADISLTQDLIHVFTSSDILITCLPDSLVVEQTILGLLNCKERKVKCLLDFSTAHPESTKQVAVSLAQVGIDMLDTPMTGGPVQADEGTIKLVVGGRKEVLEKYRKVLEAVSSKIVYAGGSGAGNSIKLMNNFLAILSQAATAGVDILMQNMNVSRDAVYDYIGSSGGNSWGFTTMMNRIIKDSFDVNFSLDLAYKDLRYNKDLFASIGGFPLLDTLLESFEHASHTGYGDKDVGAIYFSLKDTMKKDSK
ncbi:MAG: NAD(P)-dependent oxidoreductase [Spirochaetia bacterium]|nr:NAD(P)-dependent oxidoreductase [Spirochaetia bacterium]